MSGDIETDSNAMWRALIDSDNGRNLIGCLLRVAVEQLRQENDEVTEPTSNLIEMRLMGMTIFSDGYWRAEETTTQPTEAEFD